MAQTEYLDGDPRDIGVCTIDLTRYTAGVRQESQFLLELLEAGRTIDAIEIAIAMRHRAESVLRDTETPALPEVDIDRTEDVISGRRYKRT